ncbi:hypothetical protein [Oerskovia flava]|uniref:hypothetical protein n=1 Tax=Oerskovia flava TaxID=2986422 RepID=UPI00223F5078|nr:hypothetical protein [Oerskovia sp. JB1-3-2]
MTTLTHHTASTRTTDLTPYRTAALRRTDRLLVAAGRALETWGLRRAGTRAARLDRAARRAVPGAAVAARADLVDRRRDNAAQQHPLLLR